MHTDWEISHAIVEAIERAFGIMDLQSKTRTKRVADARQLAYFLMREHTKMSYPDIALMFDRDHATVFKGVKVVQGKGIINLKSRIMHDVEIILGG